jgi:hypothetical protein
VDNGKQQELKMEAENPRWLYWAITLDSPQQPRERLSGKQTSLQQGGKGCHYNKGKPEGEKVKSLYQL